MGSTVALDIEGASRCLLKTKRGKRSLRRRTVKGGVVPADSEFVFIGRVVNLL